MSNKIVFFNTGWMDFYKGVSNDTITGGGKFVMEEGYGHEMYNFLEFQGHYYGYVQPKIDKKYGNPSTIKLEKLGCSKSDEMVDNVTVVWTARNPINGGTYIVGWYLNATVFRYEQDSPKNSNRKYKDINIGYYATTKLNNARLLSIDERNIHIKRKEKDWMGQSNVWYAENNPDFIQLVKDFIFKGTYPVKTKTIKSSHGAPRQIDPLKRIEVEKKAINVVTKYYTEHGYEIQSVENDNVGWDLTATNDRIELKLEVKGLSGSNIITELTPNEFKNMKADKKFYRLCVVTETLTKYPRLKIFAYSNDTKEWTSDDGTIIKFEEIISAKVYV